MQLPARFNEDIRNVLAAFSRGNASSFTSHDFINKFTFESRETYEMLLFEFNGNRHLAHAYIANYLRYHANELLIERDPHKARTFNVTGNLSESRIWNQ